jgi:hypothetical protein
VRKFRESEDRDWPHRPEHEIGFAVHENPDDSDIVFWYVGHLHHHAAEGKDHWHDIGPTIAFEVPPASAPPSESVRDLALGINITIKDVGVFQDRQQSFSVFEQGRVDPFSPHAEVLVRQGPVGDVRAHLLIRMDWQANNSVAITFTAELFDSGQRVAQVGGNLTVLRDSTAERRGIRLVDFHGGDADMADMSFTVKNFEAA